MAQQSIKNKRVIVWGTIALVVVVVAVLAIYFSKPKSIKAPQAVKTTPQQTQLAEVKSLPQGKQTYTIKTDHPQNPQILQVTLDPLDVKIDQPQILTVKVRHSDKESITNQNAVIATYHTDNGTSTIHLKLKRSYGPPLTTVWQGTWIPKDTHNHIYMCSIQAKSAAGQSKVDLSFR